MASYELFLCDDRGRRLMPLTNLRSFSAARIVNGVGGFSAVLRPPADLATLQNYHYIERNIRPDWTVQVWQKSRGPLRLWRPYFVLNWGWEAAEDGGEVFSFGGYDVNHLLTRRLVAAYAESAQAKMTDQADDMLAAVVTDSLEDDATPVPTTGTRAWGDLSVAVSPSNGPSIDLAFAWRQLLTLSGGGVIPQIAKASRENGTEVFWDVVPGLCSNTSMSYIFRTYTGQPGRDLTSGRGKVVFDADAGTLTNWALSYDYSEEVNAVYALGQGDETNRNVQQLYDEARTKRSYWGRCEGSVEARQMETDAAVQDAGNEALSEGRPRISLRGDPVSTAGQAFGRHYDVGDKVIARAKGKQFGAIIWSAVVGMGEDGQTYETARLEYR